MITRFWHELINLSWGAWMAAAALMVGVGAFADEYYVGDELRQKVRERLGGFLQKFAEPLDLIKDMIGSLRYILPFLLWGLVPVGVYFIGRRISPNGGGFWTSIVALAFGFMLWYSVILIPFLLIMLFLVGLIFVAASFKFCKLVIWLIFRPAADPKRSPFKFATSMIGLWILLAKLTIEVTRHR